MSLLWTDGFDRYGAVADLDIAYTRTNNTGAIAFQAADGVNGGGCVRLSNNQRLTRTFPTAASLTAGGIVHAAFWFKQSAASSAGHDLFRFATDLQGASSTSAPCIESNANGSLSVTIHGNTTTIATSAAGVLSYGTYQHIEYAAKWNTSGNGGFIKVWVDGNLVIDFSGNTNTGTVPSTWTGIAAIQQGSGFNRDYDDVIAWDEVGTDFVHTQLSASYLPVIEVLSVDADDTVQFTPSAGSNFQNVDDAAFHDGDTTYNSSSTVGHEDLFTVADQGSTPQAVFAVALKTVWKIDVAGTINMRDKLNSGAATTYSADRLMTTSYALAASFFGKDPNTSAAWGTSAPNSIKVGYKYQS